MEVVAVSAPPDKANAGGFVEGQQCSDDDVALVSVCRDREYLHYDWNWNNVDVDWILAVKGYCEAYCMKRRC